jgi:hypothetical protein
MGIKNEFHEHMQSIGGRKNAILLNNIQLRLEKQVG